MFDAIFRHIKVHPTASRTNGACLVASNVVFKVIPLAVLLTTLDSRISLARDHGAL